MATAIELKDTGPIEDLTIRAPEGGGITVLRGANDVGKSYALDAISRLFGGGQPLEKRDGSAQPGEVRYGDVVLTIAKSVRRKGTAEVLSIEGKLAIHDLVDPGLKDPEAADRARTKALCRLTGATADPALFHKIFGGKDEFDAVVTTAAVDTDDLVEMQRRVKATAEGAARMTEECASHEEGRLATCRAAAEGVDLEVEADGTVLQGRLEESLKENERIETQWKHAADLRVRAKRASDAREQAEADYSGISVEQAEHQLSETEQAIEQAQGVVRDARDEVEQAKRKVQAAELVLWGHQQNRQVAEAQHAEALSHAKTMEAWAQTIQDADQVELPGDEDLEQAAEAVTDAREAFDMGANVRTAREAMASADEHAASADEYRTDAQELREAARKTESVLGQVVQADGLELKNGRWVTQVDGRGQVYFADRSRGTRAAMAIMLVAKRLRELGEATALVPFPQELWEGMDYKNRQALQAVCRELDVNVITAEADHDEPADDDGELRSEVYRG